VQFHFQKMKGLIDDSSRGFMKGSGPSWRQKLGGRGIRINRLWWRLILAALVVSGLVLIGSLAGVFVPRRGNRQHKPKDGCPGYEASNVVQSANRLTADLKLAGPACDTYGDDLDNLKLEVECQTGKYST
jgi:hypothetical protein